MRTSLSAVEALLTPDASPSTQSILNVGMHILKALQSDTIDERLIGLLTRRDVLRGLMEAALDWRTSSMVAVELVCLELPAMTTSISGDIEIVNLLLRDDEERSGCLEAWCRVLKSAIQRIPSALALGSKGLESCGIEAFLLRHLHERNVLDVAVRWFSLEEALKEAIRRTFLLKLLQLLDEDEKRRSAVLGLISKLLEVENIRETLLRALFTHTWMSECLRRATQDLNIQAIDLLCQVLAQPVVFDTNPTRLALCAALPNLAHTISTLSKASTTIRLSLGTVPRLGVQRSKLFKLLSHVPVFVDECLAEVIYECGLVEAFVCAFFSFSCNSVLQNHFTHFVQAALRNEFLVDQLVGAPSSLIQCLVQAQIRIEAERQLARPIIPAYSGHLTILGQALFDYQLRSPRILSGPLHSAFKDPMWRDYLQRSLPETLRRDNIVLGSGEAMQMLDQSPIDLDELCPNFIFGESADERVSLVFFSCSGFWLKHWEMPWTGERP